MVSAVAVLFSSCKQNEEKKTATEFKPLSETTFNLDKSGGACMFKYEIINPTDASLQVKLQDGVDWITDINTGTYGEVAFNVAVSEVETARTATITLTYETIDIELTVNQSEGEVIPAFDINVTAKDHISVTWDIVAKDKEMTYVNMIVDKATWDSFDSFDKYLEYNMKALTESASASYMTLEEYLSHKVLMSGDTTGITVKGLAPNTEYVVYAYGFTAKQELLSDVCYEVVKTEEVAMQDITFDITCVPDVDSVSLTISPSDKNAYYLYSVTDGHGHSAEDILTSYQVYISSIIDEFLSYGASGVTLETIISWIAEQGDIKGSVNELTPSTDYTAYAVSIDNTSGILNSLPSLKEFTTLEYVEDCLSTLTGDYELNLDGAIATLQCKHEYYRNGYYNWILNIKSPDGVSGDEIKIDLMVESTNEADGILTGTYKVAPESPDYRDPEAWEFIAGEYFYGYLYTWYKGNFGADGKPQTVAPAAGGTIEITNNGDGSYSVKFALEDDRTYPYIFSGSWTGTPDMLD